MLTYTLRRLVSAIPTLFIIVTLSFFLIRLAPGGPFDLERPLEPKIMENLNRAYHLDEPLWSQYLLYLGNLVQRRFRPELRLPRFHGRRPLRRRPAGFDPARRARARCRGDCSASPSASWPRCARTRVRRLRRRRPRRPSASPSRPSWSRRSCRWSSASACAGFRPAAGATAPIATWILPVITLALPQIAVIARLTRGAMIEALRSDHVRTARAYGLPPRVVVVVHALRARAAAGRLLSRAGRGGAAHRLGRRRDDLPHSRHRPLLRRRRAQPRLHAGDGHRGADRGLRHRLQPRRRLALRRCSIRACAMIEATPWPTTPRPSHPRSLPARSLLAATPATG